MKESAKSYLYHMVPDDIKPDQEGKEVLYPLNMLKEKFPDLYELKSQKYNVEQAGDSDNKRRTVMEKIMPALEQAAWGDVIHLTAIHPKDLKNALVEAGFKPTEMKFYQIDPDLLDPEQTTIYLYRDGISDENPENFSKFNPKELAEHSIIPEATKNYYKEKFSKKERPLFFVGIPHIFHKGPIDVSNFPVISTE